MGDLYVVKIPNHNALAILYVGPNDDSYVFLSARGHTVQLMSSEIKIALKRGWLVLSQKR